MSAKVTAMSTPSPPLPRLSPDLTFRKLVAILQDYIETLVDTPHTFEQLKLAPYSQLFHSLVHYIISPSTTHDPNLIAALIFLKWQFKSRQPDDRGIEATRGYACELVAWRVLLRCTEEERLEYLLHELPGSSKGSRKASRDGSAQDSAQGAVEAAPLLPTSTATKGNGLKRTGSFLGRVLNVAARNTTAEATDDNEDCEEDEDPTEPVRGLNALEIATVASAKKFMSQRVVQNLIDSLWRGDIIVWENLTAETVRKPQWYSRALGNDIFARLRVPMYLKIFEALFFASFLALYYAVLLERSSTNITPTEICLVVWIAAFAIDEFGDFRDAGGLFYAAELWNYWDLGITIVGIVYLVTRVVGLTRNMPSVVELSFDILSLEALMLVPRICSLLSLVPYFGTLIPCLKEMTKDFLKFLSVVVIFYAGFVTTFAMLARDKFSAKHISWILVNVFFGSSYLGFQIAADISPILGPPLMIVFVCLTNILLITSLISLLSASLSRVMDHSREEYLFQYSTFVLEASASRRLTYFYPPINILPLLFLKPFKSLIGSARMRNARIVLLKATHWPFLAAILAYEYVKRSRHSKPKSRTIARSRTEFLLMGENARSPMIVRTASENYGSNARRQLQYRQQGAAKQTEQRPHSAQDNTISNAEIKALLARLSKQVEELTQRLDSQENAADSK